jgi:glycosyltransferase involved in cell wall biosynthesis
LEALLCGRPVIASAVGAAPELLQDRVQGLLVSGDVDSLCRAAQLLCDHPRWAAALAAEGQAQAARVGYAQRMARQYEALFERLWQERVRAANQPPVSAR